MRAYLLTLIRCRKSSWSHVGSTPTARTLVYTVAMSMTREKMAQLIMQRTMSREEARAFAKRKEKATADNFAYFSGNWVEHYNPPRHCQRQYTLLGDDPADWAAEMRCEDSSPVGWFTHNRRLRYVLWGYPPKTNWRIARLACLSLCRVLML